MGGILRGLRLRRLVHLLLLLGKRLCRLLESLLGGLIIPGAHRVGGPLQRIGGSLVQILHRFGGLFQRVRSVLHLLLGHLTVADFLRKVLHLARGVAQLAVL